MKRTSVLFTLSNNSRVYEVEKFIINFNFYKIKTNYKTAWVRGAIGCVLAERDILLQSLKRLWIDAPWNSWA